MCFVARSCSTPCNPRDYIACQAPLSMGILQERILECVAMLLQGNLPRSEIEPRSPTLQADSLRSEPPGKPVNTGLGSLSFSRVSSQPRNQTRVSCIGGRFFTSWATRKAELIRSDQSLSCVRLFETPWIAACQASLSITNSQSSLRLTSIESVMPASHLILCRPWDF